MKTIILKSEIHLDVPDYGTHLDISALIDLVKRTGSHFFDRDTMRFFKSRVDDVAVAGVDGWYFVTSEKHESAFARINEPRMYTVRRLSLTPDGSDLRLYELQGFQAYPTLQRARTAARRAAKTGAAICQTCHLRLMLEQQTICTECEEYKARHAATSAS